MTALNITIAGPKGHVLVSMSLTGTSAADPAGHITPKTEPHLRQAPGSTQAKKSGTAGQPALQMPLLPGLLYSPKGWSLLRPNNLKAATFRQWKS